MEINWKKLGVQRKFMWLMVIAAHICMAIITIDIATEGFSKTKYLMAFLYFSWLAVMSK